MGAPTHLRVLEVTNGRGELSEETLGRLHAYAVALSAREVTMRWVARDWPEFFDLALAFSERHGSIELRDALSRTAVLDPEHRGALRGQLNAEKRRCFLLLARDLRSALVNAPVRGSTGDREGLIERVMEVVAEVQFAHGRDALCLPRQPPGEVPDPGPEGGASTPRT